MQNRTSMMINYEIKNVAKKGRSREVNRREGGGRITAEKGEGGKQGKGKKVNRGGIGRRTEVKGGGGEHEGREREVNRREGRGR